jgi:hypothetical protein
MGRAPASPRTMSTTATARIAPTGSMRIASPSSVVFKRRGSATRRRIGCTTVGPVTVSKAPNTIATGRLNPLIAQAADAAPIHVTSAPIVTKRRTSNAASFRSPSRRFNAPSNRITATASLTMIANPPPSAYGRRTSSAEGPSNMPSASNGTIAGMRQR